MVPESIINIGTNGSGSARARLAAVSDELNTILYLLREEFPDAVQISIDFDGDLRVHIDVRSHGEVAAVEASLPELEEGIFSEVRIGSAPRHPFLRRISALIAA
jgi:hypothetical protein